MYDCSISSCKFIIALTVLFWSGLSPTKLTGRASWCFSENGLSSFEGGDGAISSVLGSVL